ncbi:MAG: hypothetical protein KF729_08230 [Sandaracinaceae bacterium]|nr:hypothetical protein [Sandaracinaceae bacterium]
MKRAVCVLASALALLTVGCTNGSGEDPACDRLRECLGGCGSSLGSCTGYTDPACRSCIQRTSCESHCEFFGNPIGVTWACEAECGDGASPRPDAGLGGATDGGMTSAPDAGGSDACQQCLDGCAGDATCLAGCAALCR